jgi:hypothetical protein
MGRVLVMIGVVLVVVGVAVMGLERMGVGLGRLPGDLVWRGRRTTVYAPIGTSILLSVLLSLMLYVLSRIRR